MGIAEKYQIPFIQEVVASAEVVHQRYPEVRTLIDIGGEDAKIIFFDEDFRPDIRMNGSCAGGTGAFIDEMANLLNVPVAELNDLASRHTTIYPMASRCGVFAKTDLQNLISRQVPKEDIAASVFHAVVLQSLATLARGRDIPPGHPFQRRAIYFHPVPENSFSCGVGYEGAAGCTTRNHRNYCPPSARLWQTAQHNKAAACRI